MGRRWRDLRHAIAEGDTGSHAPRGNPDTDALVPTLRVGTKSRTLRVHHVRAVNGSIAGPQSGQEFVPTQSVGTRQDHPVIRV